MSAFKEFQQHLFLNMIPNSLWTILFHWRPLLFGTQTNQWQLAFSESFREQRCDFGVCQTFLFIVPCSTRNVVEHRHEQKYSCENFHCFSQTVQWAFDFFTWLQRIVSCEIFHSNSIGSPSIQSKFLWLRRFLPSQSLFPCIVLIGCFRESHQNTIQNPKKRRPSCVENW